MIRPIIGHVLIKKNVYIDILVKKKMWYNVLEIVCSNYESNHPVFWYVDGYSGRLCVQTHTHTKYCNCIAFTHYAGIKVDMMKFSKELVNMQQ